MNELIVPLIVYVFVTTFTPGPNNISSASFGILMGYRRTMPYLLGIFSGFILVMLCCGLLTETITELFSQIVPYLKIVGALYMAWLAINIMRTSVVEEESTVKKASYWKGFILQPSNPKVVLYGLTIYATFLAPVTAGYYELLITSVILAFMAFLSISTYTIAGSLIRTYLKNRTIVRAFNIIMGLLLLGSALSVSGLLDVIKTAVTS